MYSWFLLSHTTFGKELNPMSNKKNKNNLQNNGNTQAIAAADARDGATNRAIPNQNHVKEAKDFVDSNKK